MNTLGVFQCLISLQLSSIISPSLQSLDHLFIFLSFHRGHRGIFLLGPELDQLITRAGVDAADAGAGDTAGGGSGVYSTNTAAEIVSPYINVGPLNDEDKLSITQSLLARYTKRFSSEQMDMFLSNPGALHNTIPNMIPLSHVTAHFLTSNVLITHYLSCMCLLLLC